MTAPVLQFKRGLLANLPGLRAGEPGFTTDSYDLYVGLTSEVSTNKFFGSHRYWTRETNAFGSGVNLVEGTDNGTDFITLAAPATVGAAVTYYFPASQGSSSSVLTNDGSGNLSWASGSNNATFTGITTFSDTTDNTLGDENTGSVQLDGGMGITKNLTVKQNLHVGGHSEFVGVVTFRGGTINLGDSDTDDIVVSGEFASSLIPTTDDLYDLGDGSKRWRNSSFSGIGTFGTLKSTDSQIGNIRISNTTNTIDTVDGTLTLESFSGQVVVDDGLSVTGVSTFSQLIDANSGLDVSGQVTLNDGLSVTGVSTFVGFSTFQNDIFISGTSTLFGNVFLGDSGSDLITVIGVTTFTTSNVYIDNQLYVGGVQIIGGAAIVGEDITARHINLSGIATVSDDLYVNGGDLVTSSLTFNLINESSTNVNFAGAATDLVIANTSGITTVRNNLTVGGDIRVNGNDIQASDGNTNITLSSNTLTTFAGDIKVTGNDIQSSSGQVAIALNGLDVTVGGDLTVGGNDIKASDGTIALTFSNSTGAVTAANDLTINGNLYVSGNTTQVNTAALTVEDRTIDLGIVNGAAPASATTWDLGVLFNYHAGGSAKKSAVIWEHEDSRFKFASVLSADADGTNADSPQLAVTTFAPIEVAELWVNNTCTGGSQQVISCVGSELNLQNITIDAGTF